MRRTLPGSPATIRLAVGGWAGAAVLATAAWALDAVPGAVPAVAGAGAVATLALASMAPSLQAFGPAVCRGPRGPKVALTFDDGPDLASTERLCRALESVGARGTFFLLADRAEQHPDLVRRVVDGGHEVALHGPAHDARLTVQAPGVGAERLREAAAALHRLSGQPIRWFRPPFGATSPRLAEAVRRAGLTTVWCSVRPYDGGWARPAKIRARARRAGPGDIVLLHEGAGRAVEALPAVLSDLGARSLRAVTVHDLLEAP